MFDQIIPHLEAFRLAPTLNAHQHLHRNLDTLLRRSPHSHEGCPVCRWLGVDKVLLTENDETPTLERDLADFIESGFLDYRLDPRPHAQQLVYDDCITEHRDQYNWMAFFDLDEFLVVRDECAAPPSASLFVRLP